MIEVPTLSVHNPGWITVFSGISVCVSVNENEAAGREAGGWGKGVKEAERHSPVCSRWRFVNG